MGDELEGSVRRALHEASLDVRLEFHRHADGAKAGSLELRGPGGKSLVRLPLASPEAMNVALARLVELGFRDAPAVPAPEIGRAHV